MTADRTVVTVILSVLAFGDAPEQLSKWKEHLVSLWNLPGIDWAAFFSGNGGRWTLALSAVAVGLWSWEVPERLRAKWQGKPFGHVVGPFGHVTVKHVRGDSTEGKDITIRVLTADLEQKRQELESMTRLRDQAVALAKHPNESGVSSKIRAALQESDARRIRVGPEPDLTRLKAIHTAPKGASKAAADQGLTLRVFIVPNKGTPGGKIMVENETPKAVEGVRFIVTDLRVWSEKHQAFVTHPDIYANSATFPAECIRNHRQTLHCGVPGDYGLLRVEGNRLEVSGTHEYKTTRDGLWQMSYRVGPDDKVFIEDRICFEWKMSDDTGKPPTLEGCKCPAQSPFADETNV